MWKTNEYKCISDSGIHKYVSKVFLNPTGRAILSLGNGSRGESLTAEVNRDEKFYYYESL